MKHLFHLCVLLAFISASIVSFSPAAHAKPLIAIVDVQFIWEIPAAEEARKKIKAKHELFISDIQQKETALKKENDELITKRSVLSAAIYEEKRKALQEKQTSLASYAQTKRQILEGSLTKALNTVQTTIAQTIAGMAKEKGFEVAVPRSQVLYNAGPLDITQEVLTVLNQRLPKIDIEVKEAPAKTSTQ